MVELVLSLPSGSRYVLHAYWPFPAEEQGLAQGSRKSKAILTGGAYHDTEIDFTFFSWFLEPTFGDLGIVSRQQAFPAHRLVVSFNSPYFRAILTGGFAEAEKQKITLDDPEPLQVKKMLQYLYTAEYYIETCDLVYLVDKTTTFPSGPDTKHLKADREETDDNPRYLATFHAQMYSVGDYFQIPGLKKASMRYFYYAFGKVESQVGFMEAVTEVYSSTPASDRGLRDIVVELSTSNERGARRPKIDEDMLRQPLIA
ncbi:hypothetical protein SI65_09986 [Aspergillus cristatus]|uniref:BTB domain-containing protein n=1 Tax=Aspergillus cristatus TaxID=573508 RepID=A0A1E3B1C5_ASPCR|nr:hypothetical protein SI65_09986 [Aspergillus cristatus]